MKIELKFQKSMQQYKKNSCKRQQFCQAIQGKPNSKIWHLQFWAVTKQIASITNQQKSDQKMFITKGYTIRIYNNTALNDELTDN